MTVPTTGFLRSGVEARVARMCRDLLAGIRLWRQRRRTRRRLRDLDARLLADAGISVEASRHESAKWFWQA